MTGKVEVTIKDNRVIFDFPDGSGRFSKVMFINGKPKSTKKEYHEDFVIHEFARALLRNGEMP